MFEHMAFLIILFNYCFLNLLPLKALVQVVPPQALEHGVEGVQEVR